MRRSRQGNHDHSYGHRRHGYSNRRRHFPESTWNWYVDPIYYPFKDHLLYPYYYDLNYYNYDPLQNDYYYTENFHNSTCDTCNNL